MGQGAGGPPPMGSIQNNFENSPIAGRIDSIVRMDRLHRRTSLEVADEGWGILSTY